MNSFLQLCIVTVLLLAACRQSNALSCELLGRFGCLASCAAQNCATGYCKTNDICTCSRCSSGTIINISIGKRSLAESKQIAEMERGNSCEYGGLVGCVTSCTVQGKFCGGYCSKPSNTCTCYKC
jgi:hypothetical protein